MPAPDRSCQSCFRRPAVLSRDVLGADGQAALAASPNVAPAEDAWVTFEVCRRCAAQLDRERAGGEAVSRRTRLESGALSPSTLPGER